MTEQHRATRFIPAMTLQEGAGVTVHRTIGTPALRNYDPFLMLDHFCSDNPDDYIAGFPSHPHRGFCTFTYMIDGHLEHQDSMGNTGNLASGDAQWMKAASGVVHSEMPKQDNGLMRGFQLWINLPGANKMDNPEYQEYAAARFPVIDAGDHRVTLLVGRHGDVTAPIVDDITDVTYMDVRLEPGASFTTTLPQGHNSFLFLFEGDGNLDRQPVPTKTLIALGTDAIRPTFTAGDDGARFVLGSGRPLGEPIAQYGPFVMNTRDEIDQAMRDYQTNRFVRDRAWINRTTA
jgi:redox-sensitive bicupin YhaK (pirin superfamily)